MEAETLNLPNKLTISRIVMAPVFLALIMVEFPFHYFAAVVVFITASLTDLLDGKLARKNMIVTDFGKFLDPLADKMLTTAAFLVFISFDECRGMTVANFIILSREFLVTSARYMAALSGGKVVAANIWGKIKTVSQMVAIIMTVTFKGLMQFSAVSNSAVIMTVMEVMINISIWFSVFMTVVSGIIYLIENKDYIGIKKK